MTNAKKVNNIIYNEKSIIRQVEFHFGVKWKYNKYLWQNKTPYVCISVGNSC